MRTRWGPLVAVTIAPAGDTAGAAFTAAPGRWPEHEDPDVLTLWAGLAAHALDRTEAAALPAAAGYLRAAAQALA
ncbi:MAG: hypothetical protein AB1416_10020, partial [Actinomycetota bacterium]